MSVEPIGKTSSDTGMLFSKTTIEIVSEPIVKKDVELEEEVVDTSVDRYANMSAKDKKEYDELYGDL